MPMLERVGSGGLPLSRLTTLKPRLGTLGGPLKTLSSGGRKSGSAGIRWTGRKLQQWRERILQREPLCRHCAEQNRTTIAEVVDHIQPLEHGGSYDDANAQPLCRPCHAIKTAKDRGYRTKPTGGADGWPGG